MDQQETPYHSAGSKEEAHVEYLYMSTHSPTNRRNFSSVLEANKKYWPLIMLLLLLTIISSASWIAWLHKVHYSAPLYTDGRCDADPAQMTYVPLLSNTSALDTSSSTSSTIQIPSSWYTDRFNDVDAAYAQACAARFVQLYHTFRFSDPKTFEAATYMLSADAQKLFYQGGPADTHVLHLHMIPNWQNQIKQHQQMQEVTVDRPTILSITPLHSKYVVYLDIAYILIKERNSQIYLSRLHHKVILQSTKPSSKLPNETVGWQVVDWIDADS